MLDGDCGIGDWEIFLIDIGRDMKETRKEELFWQSKLDTFVSHFCLIAGVELLDCDYRVAGSLLLLLAY